MKTCLYYLLFITSPSTFFRIFLNILLYIRNIFSFRILDLEKPPSGSPRAIYLPRSARKEEKKGNTN